MPTAIEKTNYLKKNLIGLHSPPLKRIGNQIPLEFFLNQNIKNQCLEGTNCGPKLTQFSANFHAKKLLGITQGDTQDDTWILRNVSGDTQFTNN
jgi:hypothetical protein